MTHKEKAIELLSQMPEPYRTMALENLDRYPIIEYDYELECISDAIDRFWWHRTPQGAGFWRSVGDHYIYGTPLPELPIEYRCKQFVKENEELKRKVAELESKLKTQFK